MIKVEFDHENEIAHLIVSPGNLMDRVTDAAVIVKMMNDFFKKYGAEEIFADIVKNTVFGDTNSNLDSYETYGNYRGSE